MSQKRSINECNNDNDNRITDVFAEKRMCSQNNDTQTLQNMQDLLASQIILYSCYKLTMQGAADDSDVSDIGEYMAADFLRSLNDDVVDCIVFEIMYFCVAFYYFNLHDNDIITEPLALTHFNIDNFREILSEDYYGISSNQVDNIIKYGSQITWNEPIFKGVHRLTITFNEYSLTVNGHGPNKEITFLTFTMGIYHVLFTDTNDKAITRARLDNLSSAIISLVSPGILTCELNLDEEDNT
jgi:hypothetical protein